MKNLLCLPNSLVENLEDLSYLNINNLNLDKTMLIIIDMVNGFARCGELYSPRIEKLIKPISNFTDKYINKFYKVLSICDAHYCNSTELLTYPCHCIKGSYQSRMVSELERINGIERINKNSTDSFFSLNNCTLKYFNNVDNIIVVGDDTDICIYQFVITLKGYFNQYNMNKNIIVPMNMVDTYDTPNVHPAELYNVIYFNSMLQNGINVIKGFYY